MNRDDWLLLLLGVADADGSVPQFLDRVRVQKALFVLGETLHPANFYTFRPYHYGPFDSDVYRDAEALAQRNFVEEVAGRYRGYRASDVGKVRAAQLAAALDARTVEYVRTVRKWLLERSFNEIVQAIYDKWPNMRVNSRFSAPSKT